MYKKIRSGNASRPKFNSGILVLLLIAIFFGMRLINVLKSNSQNGALPYVELLNFGMPIIENQIYNEEEYMENTLSLKSILLKTVGLDNLDSCGLIGNEISFFKHTINNTNKLSNIESFSISEETIIRVANIEDSSLKKILDKTTPEVLIYHTHTSEAYAESAKGDKSDSDDENNNIVSVGNMLTSELEETYGISTIHDKTNHSISYNDSYSRSLETLQNYLNQNKDFKLIIDLHRDYATDKNSVTATVNGENVAKIRFVTTESSSKYSANQALADTLRNKGNELFPGFVRDDYVYPRSIIRYEQSLSDNIVLIECGAQINALQEAQNSAKLIARIIAEYINGK